MIAAMHDVAGELSQAEWKLPAEVQDRAGNCQRGTKQKQNPTEVTHRVHGGIVPEIVRRGASSIVVGRSQDARATTG